MKTTKQLLLSLATVLMSLTIINCGGGSSGSNNTTTAAVPQQCTYQNGMYYYNGQPYAQCPVTTTGVGCTYQNGMYYYNGQPYAQCPVQGSYNGIPGQYGYGYGTGNLAMCQGTCPAGLVSSQGGTMCMPQGSCGACYAQVGQYCYIGDYAHQYYGY